MRCSTSASSSRGLFDLTRPTSPCRVCSRRCAREFAGVASQKGLQFQVEAVGACVHSDRSLVEQILRNLISNAIKYTRKGWVRLRSLNEAGLVRVEVMDTGIGIPADQMPLIYDEFYQVGVPANSSRDGYGLGLSIVQRLVKLLTLKLEVQSELGKGSSFALYLPPGLAQAGAPGEVRRMAARAPEIGKVRILLVEDDVSVRAATQMLLKVEGYQVTAVDNLTDAIRRAREPFDLLVTDFHLRDGETGLQVITTLRELLGEPVKAILMTGDTSSAVKEMPRDPNLRLASKPIDADELLALLRALLAA